MNTSNGPKNSSAPDAEPAPGDDRAVSDSPRDDWAPTASWRNLRLRAELMRRARGFFDSRGFLEVETPVLSADVVVDRHLEPMSIALTSGGAAAGRLLWLQTSPEFCLKRLLAAGGEAIYQVAKVFRAGERGRLHNPEFTMLEWYRRGDGTREGMQLLSDLADELLDFGSAERVSYGEAFERYVGLDPHAADLDALRRRAASLPGGQSPALADFDRDGWLDWLLTELVQPQLGVTRPTILYDFPASQAALAHVREGEREGEPRVAERFELYVRGVELANGYHELLDPAVLRARNAESNRQRAADGKPRLPEHSRLLAAMDHGLPASCGVALGFDRLAMIAAGADSLDEVLAFPIERA